MAMDTMQKRMSAVDIYLPWRGGLVAAAEASFTQGNRQAAGYVYSGISASGAALLGFVQDLNTRLWVFLKDHYGVSCELSPLFNRYIAELTGDANNRVARLIADANTAMGA